MTYHRFPTINSIEYSKTRNISSFRDFGSAIIDKPECIIINYCEFVAGLAKIALNSINK
jgi:hypothetical protein